MLIPMRLVLADDDIDDCLFFQEALEELPIHAELNTVYDGVELMDLLKKNVSDVPDALFLDLNMPLKNGIECLTEIKKHPRLHALPVIIYSTSLNPEVVNSLYNEGAHSYIRKPTEFSELKSVIRKALGSLSQQKQEKKHFVISSKG